MSIDPRQNLDAQIVKLQKQLEQLRQIRSALDDDELRPALARVFATVPAVGANGAATSAAGKGTNSDRVRRYFNTHDNAWAGADTVAIGTGIKKEATREVMARQSAIEYEERTVEGTNRKEWRLKNPK